MKAWRRGIGRWGLGSCEGVLVMNSNRQAEVRRGSARGETGAFFQGRMSVLKYDFCYGCGEQCQQCAKSGHFHHLRSLNRVEQISLHIHSDMPESSGRFFRVLELGSTENVPLAAKSR